MADILSIRAILQQLSRLYLVLNLVPVCDSYYTELQIADLNWLRNAGIILE